MLRVVSLDDFLGSYYADEFVGSLPSPDNVAVKFQLRERPAHRESLNAHLLGEFSLMNG
jgi:hypothetical protein